VSPAPRAPLDRPVTCPSCGASNPPGAEWCGQCLTRFGRQLPARTAAPPAQRPAGVRSSGGDGLNPAPPRPPDLSRTVEVRLTPAAGGRIRRAGAELEWSCLACDTVNSIKLPVCRTCGASMLDLFRQAAPPRPARRPGVALALSALPGLGSWYAGAPADGLARLVLAAWWVSTTTLLWGRPSLVLVLVGLVFAVAAVALWVVSAVDALRLVAGRRPLTGPRVLAGAAAVLTLLLMAGLVIAAVTTGPGGPRGSGGGA
jgi:ribosomal protein L40E